MDTRYAYSVGKIRALESKMLTESQIERMLEALTIQDALRELEETEYAEGLTDIKSEDDMENILNYQLSKVYELIVNLSRDPQITNLFLISNDIDNLKIFLKAKLIKKEAKTATFNRGLFTTEAIKKMVEENNYKELPRIIAEAAESVHEDFEKDPDPQIVDILLDKTKYDYFFRVLALHENSFLEKLLRIKIDLANIKTFVRLRIRDKDKNVLQKLLISGGSLSKEIFSGLFENSLDNLIAKLQFTDYGKVVKEAIEQYQKKNRLTDLEKIFDDYLLSFIKQAKHVVFGIEPLIGYLFAKEYEIKNIRTIILTKLNRIPIEITRERLSQSYI